MASTERYRPPREAYQLPTLPQKPVVAQQTRSPTRRRDIPPAVPSPPTHSSRTSPPRPPRSRGGAPPSPAQSTPTPIQNDASPGVRGNQWFFTKDEVISSPSIIDGGLPIGEEKLRRAKGVNFLMQAGMMLNLPMTTTWVASAYFHRFYTRYSMVEEKGGIHHYNIAATALFLANKTEENCKKTKDLIIAVAKVAQKNSKLIIDEQSKEYWRWRDSILTYEELMLEFLTFDLMVDDPYRRLYECLRELRVEHNKPLRELAWAFCSDSCLTTLPLLMDGHDIAVAALFFATCFTGEKIEDSPNGEPWWTVVKGDEAKMSQAVDYQMDFYTENPFKRPEARYHGSPVFALESTRRRGETLHSQTDRGDGSSYAGTPLALDRSTQSPLTRTADAGESQANGKTESTQASTVQGDSDVTLKVAADIVDTHSSTAPIGNGVRVASGTKRKSVDDGGHDLDRDVKKVRKDEDAES